MVDCDHRHSADHALKGVAAPVGEVDALPGLLQGLREFTADLEKLAEVVGCKSGTLPILLRNIPRTSLPPQHLAGPRLISTVRLAGRLLGDQQGRSRSAARSTSAIA